MELLNQTQYVPLHPHPPPPQCRLAGKGSVYHQQSLVTIQSFMSKRQPTRTYLELISIVLSFPCGAIYRENA